MMRILPLLDSSLMFGVGAAFDFPYGPHQGCSAMGEACWKCNGCTG